MSFFDHSVKNQLQEQAAELFRGSISGHLFLPEKFKYLWLGRVMPQSMHQ